MTAQPTATRANVAALVPCYFEEKRIREVATATKAELDLVLAVDDGSTDRTSDEARAAGVEVIKHEKNAGKGAAIKTGLRALLDRPGVEFILILDGDGQHLPAEIPNFLAEANATGAAKVSTIYGDEVSKIHPVRDTLRFFKLLKRLKREAAQAAT